MAATDEEIEGWIPNVSVAYRNNCLKNPSSSPTDVATILARIMWTPNFSNANINIEMFFYEICRPLPPIQCCFSHLNLKSFIYKH
jgi:hypothetical protein